MTKEKKSYWMEDEDQNGNFTLEGKDTFDPANRYVGTRMQQGVPLLDRDWNELEDIRRYEELMLRKWYIGNGTPDDGFRISAVNPAANDFMISTGRCLVDGSEVVNEPHLSEPLFSIDSAELEGPLNAGTIPDTLITSFTGHGISFSGSIVIVSETEGTWEITDNDNKYIFRVKKKEDTLHIYPVNFILYSWQKEEDSTLIDPIASVGPSANRTDLVYLDVWIKEVKGQPDASPPDPLMNPDDLNEETTVRHKLEWLVRVVDEGTGYTPVPYHHYYNIARINNTGTISQTDIEDLREKISFSKLNVLENGDIKFTGDNIKTNALDRISPIYIRGTGKDNHAHRILRIGSTTVYDGGGRGLRLTILKKFDHSIESDKIYDTYGQSEDSDALETELNAMTKDHIGIITSYDAWESQVDEGLDAAFQRVGLIKAMSTPKIGHRRPYAAIFEPGSDEQVSKAIEVLYNRGPKEPYTEIRGWLIDGSFVGSGSAPSYLVNNLGNITSVVVSESGYVGIGTLSPIRKLEIERVGNNTELSLNERLFLDGGGSTVRVTNNAYVDNGSWAIKNPSKKAFTLEIRDTGMLELYGTQTNGNTDWLKMATFDAPNKKVNLYGNVGIGKTIPESKLHVEATNRPTIMAQGNYGGLMSGAGGGHGVFGTNLFIDSESQLRTAGTHIKGYGYSGMHTTWGNINFYALRNSNTTADAAINPASRLFIHGSDGNVGIGTKVPDYPLEVSRKDNTRARIAIYSDGDVPNDLFFGSNGQKDRWSISSRKSGDGNGYPLTIWRNNGGWSRVMSIDYTNGYVGIGTPLKPQAKLDVDGNISIRGDHTYLSGSEIDTETPGWAYYTHWIMRREESEESKALGFRIGITDIGSGEEKQIVSGPGWTKNFLIHHPLDPEHKELIHSTLEGPEIGVFYRGEAQLSNGEATVLLPDYFEALTRNENRTVLLTPKFKEDAQISMLAASGVKDGKFTVRMIDRKNPSQRFYWEVKAVRADVEILKVERMKTQAE